MSTATTNKSNVDENLPIQPLSGSATNTATLKLKNLSYNPNRNETSNRTNLKKLSSMI